MVFIFLQWVCVHSRQKDISDISNMSHFSDVRALITLPSLCSWNQRTYLKLDLFILLLYYFYLQLKLFQPCHTLILVQSFRIQC